MTLGHENAGVISEVGAGMDHWQVGERVGLSPVMPDGDAIGYGAWDGGYGPKVRATEANLVRLPDEVSFEMGAMATDAGLTSYHAMVTRGGVRPGMRLGVIGLAGFAGSATEFAGKELELIVDYAGFGTTTAQAVEALGEFGTLVQVGMGRLEATVSTNAIILKRPRILGSKSGTKQNLEELYGLMRSGDLNPPLLRITPDRIPEGLERLREGGLTGRLIALYEG